MIGALPFPPHPTPRAPRRPRRPRRPRTAPAALCIAGILQAFCLHALQAAAAEQALVALRLAVRWAEIRGMTRPVFDVTAVNVSGKPIRVLDIRRRPDFVDSFLDVEIAAVDRDFEFQRMISDPNVIEASDYVGLSPGQTVEFRDIVLPIDYRDLVPGRYRARAVFRIDPIADPRAVYRSAWVTFALED